MIDTRLSAPAAVKAVLGGSFGIGLVADGIINTSTGSILAGLVMIVGTAVVTILGQLWAAQTKAKAERRAADLKSDAEERESLLKDSREREKELKESARLDRAKIDVLQAQLLDAEKRAARNYRDGNNPPQQPV